MNSISAFQHFRFYLSSSFHCSFSGHGGLYAAAANIGEYFNKSFDFTQEKKNYLQFIDNRFIKAEVKILWNKIVFHSEVFWWFLNFYILFWIHRIYAGENIHQCNQDIHVKVRNEEEAEHGWPVEPASSGERSQVAVQLWTSTWTHPANKDTSVRIVKMM